MIVGSFSCQLQIQKWIASLIFEETAWHWRSPPSPSPSQIFCLASLHIPEQRTESLRSWNKTQDLFYQHFKGIRRWRIDVQGFLCHGDFHIKCSSCAVAWQLTSVGCCSREKLYTSLFLKKIKILFPLVPIQEACWSLAEIRIPVLAETYLLIDRWRSLSNFCSNMNTHNCLESKRGKNDL